MDLTISTLFHKCNYYLGVCLWFSTADFVGCVLVPSYAGCISNLEGLGGVYVDGHAQSVGGRAAQVYATVMLGFFVQKDHLSS